MSPQDKPGRPDFEASLPSGIEPAHDVLRQTLPHPLDPIFAARTVALIGATENPGSVGLTLMHNLNSSGTKLFPVNPKRATVLGVKAYPDVRSIPEPVDLAVIVTPAQSVPGIIRECADLGIRGAVIISAGFKETGAGGVELEQQVLAQARRGKMRVIGPNCLGVMMPHAGFNATFASTLALPGSVAFISQSGALCTAVLDWSLRENVGFSGFISIGSMLDVNWGDLIYYFGDDPRTKSIVMYMESIGDARSFLSAAREVALTKPIIVIKVGRTDAAAKAAASHTGSLTGSDHVLDAAFRRVGVLRVDTIAELFDMAEVLSKQPRPSGPRLAIVTNAGGPGVLATDSLIGSGGKLAELSPDTFAALQQLLPAHWSRNNPVDILGDADPQRYGKAIDIVAKDPANDSLLVILTPQAMTDPAGTAEQLKPFAKLANKPIIASWMGGREVEPGVAILNGCNIPTFAYPDRAARAFHYMWRYSENLRSLYETPALALESDEGSPNRPIVDAILQSGRTARRAVLTEVESKEILAAYGIPTVETKIARTAEQAVELAAKTGFPVVLKLYSETITHKTDVGGVQLNLGNAAEVKRAWRSIETGVKEKAGEAHFGGVTVQPMVTGGGYEVILGSSTDPQFGPVILFGAGGQLVEIFKDSALGLPPLNATLARRLLEQTRIYSVLKGVRGRKAVDLSAVEELLVRFSFLVAEQRWIKEIDINPLLVSAERIIALDARVALHDPSMTKDRLPTLAIRPYPSQYVTPWKLKDGTLVTIRPIRPEDEPLLVKFHQTLSEKSVYNRYFSALKLSQRIAHERLIRICHNDYDREIALVAEHKTPKKRDREILGVGRLSKIHGVNEAEFAILVSDQWQGRGLGAQLLNLLIQVGRHEKLARITGTVLAENREMQHICKKLGFNTRHEIGQADCEAEIIL